MKRMKIGLVGVAAMAWVRAAGAASLSSPDGRVVVSFSCQQGNPVYSLVVAKQPVLVDSKLGLVRDDEDFTQGLTLLQPEAAIDHVDEHYEMLTGKRRENHYLATRGTFHLRSAKGRLLDLVFQVSNDGAAFRYQFPEQTGEARNILSEATTFHFPPEQTHAWLQSMQVAKSGWMQSNPAYEEYYQKDVPLAGPAAGPGAATRPADLGAGWVYPALFHTGDVWVALTEAGLGRDYCGTHLNNGAAGEFGVALADLREVKDGGAALPEGKLPWATPWRVICVGTLKQVAESTLGTDVADKPDVKLAAAVKPFALPGKASWSWPLLGDKNTTFPVQKQFIDYAAEMGWGYCLIDALWDKQIGDEKLKELCADAAAKTVGVLVWYNSAGAWNTTPQTPRDKLLTHEKRIAEFAKLQQFGVKGIKVDFFGGDGQSMINYYLDIMEDAAAYGLMVNFHGATLPRGWERTYPHLMTMEAIRGFEYCTFEQANADQEPTHAAMLPFTRNLFDPMDFTPVCLDQVNSKVQRRTTSGFELALSVLFTSGIQHYVETPAGMAKMPSYVKDFMKAVPSVWEDTKFVEGYPGKYVVMARKGAGTDKQQWYVAGINGEDSERDLELDLAGLGVKQGTAIFDGAPLFEQRPVVIAGEKVPIQVKPHGGFVMVLE